MKKYENDSLYIDVDDFIPVQENISQEEIKFVRHYFRLLNLQSNDDNFDFIFSTTFLQLGNFLVNIVRENNKFQKNIKSV